MPVKKRKNKLNKNFKEDKVENSSLQNNIIKSAREIQESRPINKFNIMSVFEDLKAKGLIKNFNQLQPEFLDLERKGLLLNIGGSWWRVL